MGVSDPDRHDKGTDCATCRVQRVRMNGHECVACGTVYDFVRWRTCPACAIEKGREIKPLI